MASPVRTESRSVAEDAAAVADDAAAVAVDIAAALASSAVDKSVAMESRMVVEFRFPDAFLQSLS